VASQLVSKQSMLSRRADGAFDAQLELACGCVVTVVVPAERTVELESGERRVAGKFRCPKEHRVTNPA
jgi:hypothetical protein